MENRADKPLMSKLVRKSSVDGSADARSICGSGGGSSLLFLPRLNVFAALMLGSDGPSESVDAAGDIIGILLLVFLCTKTIHFADWHALPAVSN